MRRVAVGMIVIVCGLWGAFTGWEPRGALQAQQVQAQQIQAQQVQPAVKPLVLSDGLIALSSDTADGHQQVVVIDSKTKGMSVYHIDHKTGTSTLKSVRNLQADLEMDEYNTDNPLPREIRAILNKR